LHKGLDAAAHRGLGTIKARRVSDLAALRNEAEAIMAAGENSSVRRDGKTTM
jgi:hypothetical protein